MTQEILKKALDSLYKELENSNNKNEDRKILAKAVQLGIQYQTEKIKQDILQVFENKK